MAGVVQFAQSRLTEAVRSIEGVPGLEAGVGPKGEKSGLAISSLPLDQPEQAPGEAMPPGGAGDATENAPRAFGDPEPSRVLRAAAGRGLRLRRIGLRVEDAAGMFGLDGAYQGDDGVRIPIPGRAQDDLAAPGAGQGRLSSRPP